LPKFTRLYPEFAPNPNLIFVRLSSFHIPNLEFVQSCHTIFPADVANWYMQTQDHSEFKANVKEWTTFKFFHNWHTTCLKSFCSETASVSLPPTPLWPVRSLEISLGGCLAPNHQARQNVFGTRDLALRVIHFSTRMRGRHKKNFATPWLTWLILI